MNGKGKLPYNRPKFGLDDKAIKVHWGREFERLEKELVDSIGDDNDVIHQPINDILTTVAVYRFKLAPEHYCSILGSVGKILEYVDDLENNLDLVAGIEGIDEEEFMEEPQTPHPSKKQKFDFDNFERPAVKPSDDKIVEESK